MSSLESNDKFYQLSDKTIKVMKTKSRVYREIKNIDRRIGRLTSEANFIAQNIVRTRKACAKAEQLANNDDSSRLEYQNAQRTLSYWYRRASDIKTQMRDLIAWKQELQTHKHALR